MYIYEVIVTIGNEDIQSKFHEGFFLSKESAEVKKKELQDLLKEQEDQGLLIEINPRIVQGTENSGNSEYWTVLMQMKNNGSGDRGDGWDDLKVLSYFTDLKLAKEFYDVKMKQIENCDIPPAFTFRLIHGRMHDGL